MPISEIVRRLELGNMPNGQRLDAAAIANGTLFLERELTQVRSKVLEVKYGENKAITFLPLATDIHPDAETYTWKVTNSWGQARIIHGDEKSLPRVGADAVEKTGKVVDLGLSYGWTRKEMRTALWQGMPLSNKLAMAARRGCETSIDELLRTGKIVSTGQTANGLGGFCNNPDVGKALVFSAWLSQGSPPTSLAIYNELVALASKPRVETLGNYDANTMLVASALFEKISSTPMFSFGETTILEYFLRNSPNIKQVAQWAQLDSTGDGTIGTSGYHQIIVYQRDADVVEAVVPIRFEQLPPQVTGFNTEVPCLCKCGGVKIYAPKAIQYGFVNHSTT